MIIFYKIKQYLITIGVLASFSLNAQIASLPHTESFETTFTIGNNVDFIPNWLGNEVDVNSRIFQTSNKELGMIATGSFTPEVQVRLNLLNYENIAVSFKAKGLENGEGERNSSLFIETSHDGGFTWHTTRKIQTFENEDSPFKTYKYILPGVAGNKKNILLKLFLQRSEEGQGTTPKIIIDDFIIYSEDKDMAPPEVIGATAVNSKSVRVKYNDKMGTSSTLINNYSGLPHLTSITPSPDSSTFTLVFSEPFGIGKLLNLTISNVLDKAGNKMASPYSQNIIFNDTRPNLFITEIMYHSPAEEDSLEYLEIFNKGPEPALLGGLYFSAGLTYTLPEYTLAAGDYFLIASNSNAAQTIFEKPFYQWTAGSLDNSGEKIEIKNSSEQVITAVKYERNWGGDGNGRSLSYCYPVQQTDNSNPLNWSSTQDATGKSVNGIPLFASPGKGCGLIIPEIRFDSYSSYAFEGATKVKVSMTLVNPNANSSSILLKIDEASTATFGSDYTSSTNFPVSIQFLANTLKKEVEIQILDDTKREGLEKAIFQLLNPTNALIGGQGFFELNILDNDDAITQVCINELSASNNSLSGIKDEYGNSDDWIELKNGSDFPITLAGYFVTDNPDNLTKHQLPFEDVGDITIPANGYLILWADNEPNQGSNHLSFALSSSGEYFALVMPDGKTIVDEISFPSVITNQSYGRAEDCKETWKIFESPTFKASNFPTSIIYRSDKNPIILFPNPNHGDILYLSEPIDYMIFDIRGVMLKSGQKAQQIDISALPNGIMMISTKEGASTKFIINR
ncbi:MAG: lamin tail domain-containing protein [Chitinophagales bacterium]|nr:lamin tail domain-containing protein [Chitinophagales bacterium]